MQAYPHHPLCEMYPLTDAETLDEITEDMRENGFDPRFACVLYQAQLLDGRTRQIAAQRAGVEPIYKQLAPDENPETFVRRANENRRHISPEWLKKKRRERLERVAQAREAGATTRDIAKAEGISQAQAARDVADLDSGESNGTTAGANGRKPYGSKKKEVPLCDRCKRVGIVTGCMDCARLSGGKRKGNKKKLEPSTNGKPVYDWRSVQLHFGAVVRDLDEMAKAYKIVKTPEVAGLHRCLEEYWSLVDLIRDNVSNARPPLEKRPKKEK